MAIDGGIYVLDEPTSGFSCRLADVDELLQLLDRWSAHGNSVMVIARSILTAEHLARYLGTCLTGALPPRGR